MARAIVQQKGRQPQRPRGTLTPATERLSVNEDLVTLALRPHGGISSLVLLQEMRDVARRDVVEALAAVLVRRDARELADYLADGPLTKAREAAAGPEAALAAARQAR
jgi:hypothetical protein